MNKVIKGNLKVAPVVEKFIGRTVCYYGYTMTKEENQPQKKTKQED